jgi:hypothetical protein
MIRTKMVTSPPTLALFFSCISYLEEDKQKGFLEDLEQEAFPEYEATDML